MDKLISDSASQLHTIIYLHTRI